MIISNGGFHNKKVAFSGQKKVLDDYGAESHKFFYPYDSNNYTATVEIYRVKTTKDGKYKVVGEPVGEKILLDKEGKSGEIKIEDYVDFDDKYAYRYVLEDKDGNKKYAFDPGIVTNIKDGNKEIKDGDKTNKFNIVFNNRAITNKAGKMQLIMPDEYYPGVMRGEDGRLFVNKEARDKALNSIRTHANKLGGTLAGITYKLPELKKEGYSRIVGMPITKDTLSSHLYWTQNSYQVSPQLGGMEEFKEFQKELFKNGINWVSDAALVNEGLQGIHFKDVLKWGKDSPYFNWFKITGLDSDGMKLGVLPAKTENVRYKIVNCPFNLDNNLTKNENYDPKKTTYIQFYDDRLVSDEQRKSNNLIETYDKNNPENSYEITAHDDVVYPYNFEINPLELKENIKNYKKNPDNKSTNLQSMDAIRSIMKFGNFSIVSKPEAGGFEMWDGNTDIAKLSFYISKNDQALIDKLPEEDKKEAINDLQQGVLQVVDSAVNSGKYWTKLASDVQLRAAVDVLKGTQPTVQAYREKIDNEVKSGNLPPSTKEVMTDEVISNILNDNYYLPRVDNNHDDVKDYILRNLMDYPLETLPLADDLLAVVSSPYIQKRATTKDEVGVSRLDIFRDGEQYLPEKYKEVHDLASSVYTNELYNFAYDVVKNMDMDLIKDDQLTTLGKYVVNEIMPEITQYAMLKGIDRGVKIPVYPNGKIDFSKVDPDKLTTITTKVASNTPEKEALAVVEKLRTGIAVIPPQEREKLSKAFEKRFANIDTNAYRMADAIVDRTESGMGWRIDAAKDVSSIDAVREGVDSFGKAWENVIFVWKKFNEAVKEVNPHVYTTAEITDVDDLTKLPNTDNGRFKNDVDKLMAEGGYKGIEDIIHPETKFLEETGITTTANYSFFFSLLPELYNNSIEKGDKVEEFGDIERLKKKLDHGWDGNPGLSYNTPLDGIIHSYTFVGNHDKPRILHMLALNMPLFYSDLSNDWQKKDAARVLGFIDGNDNPMPEKVDPEKTSGMAIAMGQALNDSIKKLNVDKQLETAFNKAVADLASGTFKNKPIDSKAFGARSFEIAISNVFEQMEFNKGKQPYSLDNNQKNELEAKLHETILKPAFDKYLTIYKTLITLPGDATDFAGDKLASTGFETKSKNYYQQNRNTIRWEWLEDPNRQYIKNFYDKLNKISDLRTEKKVVVSENGEIDYVEDKKLSALNDGVPVTLSNKNNNGFTSILRYNDKDSMVVTLYNVDGVQEGNTPMTRSGAEIDKILLDSVKIKEGLVGGLKVGTTFKSKRDGDDSIYKVVQEDGQYFLMRYKDDSNVKIRIEPEDYNALVLYKDDED